MDARLDAAIAVGVWLRVLAIEAGDFVRQADDALLLVPQADDLDRHLDRVERAADRLVVAARSARRSS